MKILIYILEFLLSDIKGTSERFSLDLTDIKKGLRDLIVWLLFIAILGGLSGALAVLDGVNSGMSYQDAMGLFFGATTLALADQIRRYLTKFK